ncbi:hypothetical protein AC1031_012087 [Aphanomyces cochlioides]|nr:hypothetical protein AC1031_012087 [Aphanomyces cochlioides]
MLLDVQDIPKFVKPRGVSSLLESRDCARNIMVDCCAAKQTVPAFLNVVANASRMEVSNLALFQDVNGVFSRMENAKRTAAALDAKWTDARKELFQTAAAVATEAAFVAMWLGALSGLRRMAIVPATIVSMTHPLSVNSCSIETPSTY